MPSGSKCRTTRRSPIVHPIPVALLSIAFYAYDYDSSTVDVHWDGIGKYLNFAFRCEYTPLMKLTHMHTLRHIIWTVKHCL